LFDHNRRPICLTVTHLALTFIVYQCSPQNVFIYVGFTAIMLPTSALTNHYLPTRATWAGWCDQTKVGSLTVPTIPYFITQRPRMMTSLFGTLLQYSAHHDIYRPIVQYINLPGVAANSFPTKQGTLHSVIALPFLRGLTQRSCAVSLLNARPMTGGSRHRPTRIGGLYRPCSIFCTLCHLV
jgi:hypothetical protein